MPMAGNAGRDKVRIQKYIFFGLVLFLEACAFIPEPTRWTPPITNAQAAFLWQHGDGSLVGDAIITSDARGNVMIRLTKNLPRPLLKITVTADGKCIATGAISAGGWSGDVARAPVRFRLWLALAGAWRGALAAPEGRQEVNAAIYRAAVWKESGRIRELSVSSNDNSEMIRLIFRS